MFTAAVFYLHPLHLTLASGNEKCTITKTLHGLKQCVSCTYDSDTTPSASSASPAYSDSDTTTQPTNTYRFEQCV